MFKRSRALASVAVIAVVVSSAAPAFADTLRDAIALAYRTNPTLQAQRASQRALDEAVPQARAGLRPEIGVSVSANYTRTDSAGSGPVDINGDGIPDTAGSGGVNENDNGNATISLSQTLYAGGRIARAIDAADADVRSGREGLRGVEQQILASVIQAYVDVLRDLEILRIREANLQVLRRQLDESNARFEVGEITRTDVAQSEARLAQSEADLAGARAQLSVSRAAYASVVGQAPADLTTPPALPGVPDDFEAALDVGLAENPAVLAAEYDLRAAEARAAQARSAFMPSVGVSASYGGSDDLSSFDPTENTSFRAGATLTVPLFTGGLNRSRLAQALEQANAARARIRAEERTVLQSVSSSYAQIVSANSQLSAGEESVRAARIAAEGVRQEQQVGLRTTLDVLNAELELRNAEITLAQARRNQYVAQAQLLAAMGRLSGEDLVPDLDVYDPTANAARVAGRGGLPTDLVVETLDRIAAPPVTPAIDGPEAPVDEQLNGEVVRTAPRGQ
ncbi:type I secretion protein TolC [Brevundimonas sp. AAP58]|uniref:TolC family outer membrane protein n=1 Tax=Brevundimonas sp. AAP58 TaxID=1523422 RepID=UPI0006B922E6|nr:TolC family outer membrane protein [Brevundimonas sp. AAP58]KPF77901.1 type I secretion protein TolC [Brevundimonas sp. AAP58]